MTDWINTTPETAAFSKDPKVITSWEDVEKESSLFSSVATAATDWTRVVSSFASAGGFDIGRFDMARFDMVTIGAGVTWGKTSSEEPTFTKSTSPSTDWDEVEKTTKAWVRTPFLPSDWT